MIEIHRNGSGEPVINVGDIIKIVILIVSVLVFYFTNQIPTVRTLENHDTRIDTNEKCLERHETKIDHLEQTKVNKD